MKALLLFFILIPIISFAEDFNCPPDTILVDFVISFSKERMQVCQKKIDGQFVKHGPEILYKSDGTIKSKNYYQLGVLVDGPQEEKRITEIDDSIKRELDSFFDTMLGNLFHFSGNKKMDFVSPEYCNDSMVNRLNFVLRDVPYTNPIKFKKQCSFEGNFRNEFNKKLSAEFKILNIFDYKKISYDYFMTKKQDSESISITIDFTNGMFSSDSKTVKFTGNIRVKTTLQEALASAGKRGTEVEHGIIDVTEYNGSAFKYHREF